MPWRVFFFWNAAGGITWAASVIGLGYFFGHSLHVIKQVLGIGGVIAVVTAAIVALVFWRRFEKRKVHAHDDDAPAPA
jgi:membrane protein DedA with SNARE-associated domain